MASGRVAKLISLEQQISEHLGEARTQAQPLEPSADPSLRRTHLSEATAEAGEAHELIRHHIVRVKAAKRHIEEMDQDSGKHGLHAELVLRVESCVRLSSELNEVSSMCRKREAELRKGNRDALLRSSGDKPRTKELAGAEQKKKNVTDSLRRSRQVLAQEVQRVASAGVEVKKGTGALEKLNEQQREINMTAEQAKTLLTAIEVIDNAPIFFSLHHHQHFVTFRFMSARREETARINCLSE
jgi:hypothetical protein